MSFFVHSCKTNIFLLNPKLCNYIILRSIRAKRPNTFVSEVDKDGFRILELLPKKPATIEKDEKEIHPLARTANNSLTETISKVNLDKDWSSVWPGPKTFHPDYVPIPIRQGYPEKNEPPKGKYSNTELMKIPNFLHLTPPAIKKHCEAIKKFCTKWPEELKTDEDCTEYFPLNVIYSDYCYAGPSIREPLSRIVTFKVKLSNLSLDIRAKDKLLRLLEDRYDPKTDYITITTDRCPMRKQNYDYAEFLLTAVYHESKRKEEWENQKTAADREYYDWEENQSKKNLITMYAWPEKPKDDDYSHIPHAEEYKIAVTKLMNEGENEDTLQQYKEAVKKIMFLKRPEENNLDASQ